MTLFDRVFKKTQNLAEILQLEDGLQLKLGERAFDTANFRVCTRLLNSGVKPDTVFDVGANQGQFALAAHRVFGAVVHCFEPLPAALTVFRGWAGSTAGIHIHATALGPEVGETEFHVTNQGQSSSILHLHENHKKAYPYVAEVATIKVPVSTLDAEMERLVLPSFGDVLLKLDVQGFEGDVLKGARRALERVRWLLLETSQEPMYQGQMNFQGLQALLAEQGFVFSFPVDIHLGESTGGVAQFDALFTRV